MSEKQTSRQNQSPRPIVTPEQLKLFSHVYRDLTKFATTKLMPHMAVGLQYGDGEAVMGHWDEKTIEAHNHAPTVTTHIAFNPNSHGGEVHTGDTVGWVDVNDEGGAHNTGDLATVTLYGEDGNQDIYNLHFDGNVEHERYGDFGKTDEDGYNVDETISAGWLSTEEIEALGRQIEHIEPGWTDTIAAA